jgi:hypothetical protein
MDLTAHNPFAILTLIAAPAILTNAASVLALSTSNRFLRVSDRMRLIYEEVREKDLSPEHRRSLLTHADRSERQGILLLRALRCVYIALGSFAAASLVSILGAMISSLEWLLAARIMIVLALVAGFTGVGALILSSVRLFHATRLSLTNVSEQAAAIRRSVGDSSPIE